MRTPRWLIPSAFAVAIVASLAAAQGTKHTNPNPGDIWTYFGPTIGSGWGASGGAAGFTLGTLAIGPGDTVTSVTGTVNFATLQQGGVQVFSVPGTGLAATGSTIGIAANGVANASLAQAAAGTLKGNPNIALSNVTDIAVPSCPDSAGNHLNWAAGVGFSCGNSGSGPATFGGQVVTTGTSTTLTTPTSQLYTVVVNKATGAAHTINLPVTPPTQWFIIRVKDGKGDASTNPITVAGNGNTIDTLTTNIINQPYASRDYQWDGTAWRIV